MFRIGRTPKVESLVNPSIISDRVGRGEYYRSSKGSEPYISKAYRVSSTSYRGRRERLDNR